MPARRCVPWRAVCTTAALIFAGNAMAQAVTSLHVSKSIVYEQTSSGTGVIAPMGHVFNAGVLGSNLGSLTPPTLTGPIDPAAFNGTLQYAGDQWSVWVPHASAAQRDGRFGSGTYTMTAAGTAFSVQLTGDLYPNAPVLTLTGGRWQGGRYYIDPAQSLGMSTNAFSGYATYNGSIHLGWGVGSSFQNQSVVPTDSMSVTVPANTFTRGQTYGLSALFAAYTNANITAMPGVYAAASYATFTSATLVADTPPPLPDYVLVDKSRRYDQVGPAEIVPKPPRAPCNFQCGFAFSARVGGTNVTGLTPPTVTGPIDSSALGAVWRGGVMGLNSGIEWQLFYPPGGEWNGPTQADIDSKFANGVYTITAQGQTYSLNLTGDAYPSPPVMTVTGTGSWTGGRYVFDPRSPMTVSVTAAALGPRGGLVGIYYCIPGGPCRHGGHTANSASFPIPANTFADGEEPFFVATFSAFVDQTFGSGGMPHAWAAFNSGTDLKMKASIPQRFPLTVTSNVTPTVANATAVVQPRPQDVGTNNGIFVFAVAPSNKVLNASLAGAQFPTKAKGAKADSVQCVLAQLNASGQLQAVAAANLQAFVFGVLTTQGVNVNILNQVLTSNIAGASFYVGYGRDPLNMIATGVNQKALEVAGDVACRPEGPKTGWWWNPNEGGRGYSIEVSRDVLFFAAYLYDVTGRATWTISTGYTSIDGSLYTSRLENYSGGQTLSGAPRQPNAPTFPGDLTLAFSDGSHGTLVWPGGTIPIERFNIVANGTALAPRPNEPQSGWWWNPLEGGRGYFLEWQGGQLFMAGYMYDDAGNPIWYLTADSSPSSNLRSYSGTWWQFANGPTMMGPYRPATRTNDNVAPVTIEFQGPDKGILTLPGGRTTNIQRYF